MNPMFFALILATCFAFAWPACTPEQWEGYEGSIGGYVDRGRPGIIKEFVSIHYDYKNRRSAVFLDYVNGEYENKFKILAVGKKDDEFEMYVVNTKDDSCWIKIFKKSFRQICVPEDAKHVGDYFLGLEGGFKLSAYEYRKEDMGFSFSVSVAGSNIIPVSETVIGSIRGVHFIQTIGFMDITPGIKNATVFDVPSECKMREDVTMMEQLTRQHYILAL